MKRKDLLLLTLLLTQTVPVWAMDPPDDFAKKSAGAQAKTQHEQAKPQYKFEFIEYIEPTQVYPHPRGSFRVLPEGEIFTCNLLNPQHVRFEATFLADNLDPVAKFLPKNLGMAQERVKYDFKYETETYNHEILCPNLLPLIGKWDIIEDRIQHKDFCTLKLKTSARDHSGKNQPRKADQDKLLLKVIDHKQRDQTSPEILGDPYYSGTTVYREKKTGYIWESPRFGATPYPADTRDNSGEAPGHEDYKVIYVEPFPLGKDQPKESKMAYKGEYERGFLTDDIQLPGRETGKLLYSDGADVYLPHVTQEQWTRKDDRTKVGFFIASYKKNSRLNFIPGHVLFPNFSFSQGLYCLSLIKDLKGGMRHETWKKLGDNPHEVTLLVRSQVPSIPGMIGFDEILDMPDTIEHYDVDQRILSLKGGGCFTSGYINRVLKNYSQKVHEKYSQKIPDEYTLQKYKYPQQLNVYALNGLSFDESIYCYGTSCSFIAPGIIFEKDVTIDLSGFTGKFGGPLPGEDGGPLPGEDGGPGDPGGPGGNLFMMAYYNNFSHYQCTANLSGGSGGRGGNGADGAKGKSGRTYLGQTIKPEPGQNGGKAGPGGKKGLPGDVLVQDDSAGKFINIITDENHDGEPGAVGRGGVGGFSFSGDANPGNPGVGVSDVETQDPVPPTPLNIPQLIQDYKNYYYEVAKKPGMAPSIYVFPNLP